MSFTPFDNDIRTASLKDKFARETQITHIGQNSKAGALLETFLSELRVINDSVPDRLAQSNPEEAEGIWLEMWADLLGESPEMGEVANASANDQVVKFYVDTGTFGDINDGASLTITTGDVYLYGSKREIEEGNFIYRDVEYRLTEDVVLDSGDSEQWISVAAVDEGQLHNIPANTLVNHTFREYTDQGSGSLKVTNVEPIINGEDPENEERLRSRILRSSFGRVSDTESRLISAADAVPGVSNVYSVPGFSGPGTYDLFVDTESFTVPQTVLLTVADRLAAIPTIGSVKYVQSVPRVGVSMVLDVYVTTMMTDSDQTGLRNLITTWMTESIITQPLGAEVNFLETHSLIKTLDARILRVGTSVAPYSALTLFYSGSDGQRIGSAWDPNQVLSLESYERLYTEEGTVSPVQVRFILPR